jgi:8-oxo-dGTP pyrophosphatase MutT (NUDIX family)
MIVKAALLTFRNNDTELLFVRPKGRDYFIFPGGKQDPGETIDKALERELEEELGCQVDEAKNLGTVRGETPDGRDIEMHLYSAELIGEPKPQAEIVELKWLTREEALQNSAHMTPMTLDHVLPFLSNQGIW